MHPEIFRFHYIRKNRKSNEAKEHGWLKTGTWLHKKSAQRHIFPDMCIDLGQPNRPLRQKRKTPIKFVLGLEIYFLIYKARGRRTATILKFMNIRINMSYGVII